jgi:hypothetical protein
MKKLFVIVMAACTIGLAACGNKTAQQGDAANAAVENADIENATADLAAQLESGDVNKFQEALNAVQAKVAEMLKDNPEQAQRYLENVQGFLKENTEKIKEVVGDNAVVASVVTTLIETPAESMISNLSNVVSGAQEKAAAKADETKQDVKDAVDNVKQAAQDKANEAKQAAADKVNEAAGKANEKINEGADKLLKGAGLK